MSNGGEGGIRTHERVAPLLVFKTSAFNRSATSPDLICTTLLVENFDFDYLKIVDSSSSHWYIRKIMNFSLEITIKPELSTLPKVKDVYITMLPGDNFRNVVEKAK